MHNRKNRTGLQSPSTDAPRDQQAASDISGGIESRKGKGEGQRRRSVYNDKSLSLLIQVLAVNLFQTRRPKTERTPNPNGTILSLGEVHGMTCTHAGFSSESQ
jgi:hypothetical protein